MFHSAAAAPLHTALYDANDVGFESDAALPLHTQPVLMSGMPRARLLAPLREAALALGNRH